LFSHRKPERASMRASQSWGFGFDAPFRGLSFPNSSSAHLLLDLPSMSQGEAQLGSDQVAPCPEDTEDNPERVCGRWSLID
jgi:hypothetical protein